MRVRKVLLSLLCLLVVGGTGVVAWQREESRDARLAALCENGAELSGAEFRDELLAERARESAGGKARGGEEQERRVELCFESRIETAAIAGPNDAMLARQLSGDAVNPVTAFAKARAQAAESAAATKAEAPAVATAEWQLTGPTNVGGRVLDVVIDPEDGDTVYAATASGGVFKSTDGGRRFAPAWPTDEVQPIGALAISPEGVLYAGTGEAGPGGGSITYGGRGIFRSADGGETWQHLGLDQTSRIGRIVVDPNNSKRIWVAASGNLFKPGGQRGLYRSDDEGESWTKVLAGTTPTTGAVDVAVHPSDPKVIYTAMWDHQREPNAHRYQGLGSGLFRSADGGATWTRTGGPTLTASPTLGRIGVAIAESDPKTVYAIAQNQGGRQAGLVKTVDGGATWSFLPDRNLVTAGASFAWWFGRVYVNPTDANDVFVAGVTLVRSRNGGSSSQSISSVHADQHGMAWDRTREDVLYLGNDGGVYRSEDGGATYEFGEYQPWSQLYSLDVSEQDPRRQVAGLQDNGSNRSWRGADEPSPSEWNGYVGGDGLRTLIKPGNQNVIYGCSQYGGCAISTNGGNTTTSFSAKVVSSRKNWFTPIEFDPEDANTVYTGGEIMSRSTDNASTWVPISPELSDGPQPDSGPDPDYKSYGSLTTIGPAGKSTGRIYAGTDDGNLSYTADNGLTWTRATDADLPKAWITRVEPDLRDASGKTAFVTYSGFRAGDAGDYVFRTTDGGKRWDDVTGDLPQAPVNDINVVGDLLVVATDLGVFGSADEGTTWRKIGSNLPAAPVHELRYIASTKELYAATFGRSMWKVDLPAASAF